MHLNLRYWLGLAFLLGVALATLYWSQMETAGLLDTPDVGPVPEGYYLLNATILVTDGTGAVRYRILSRRAEELPEENLLRLAEVSLEYRAADQAPWLVSASVAEGPADRSYLDLSGEVTVSGSLGENGTPVLLETTRLRLEPETWVARSKERVSMVFGNQRLSGVGLWADLMEDRLELESDVHGQIVR
jgi:lipopolysaccharide export system protein LptC